jgi:hypothetical protein
LCRRITTPAHNFNTNLDVAQSFNNTWVDSPKGNINGNCLQFWNTSKKGAKPAIYTGDYALGVANTTGEHPPDLTKFFCGFTLEEWQQNTGGQDLHSRTVYNKNGEYGAKIWIAEARSKLFAAHQQGL